MESEHWLAGVVGYAAFRGAEAGGRWLIALFVANREQKRKDDDSAIDGFRKLLGEYDARLQTAEKKAELSEARAKTAEAKVEMLEVKIKNLESQHEQCTKENAALRERVEGLEKAKDATAN